MFGVSLCVCNAFLFLEYNLFPYMLSNLNPVNEFSNKDRLEHWTWNASVMNAPGKSRFAD